MRRTIVVLGAALVALVVAAQGQTFLGKSLNRWREQLAEGKTPSARRSAAFALGRMRDPEAVRALVKALRSDADPGVRDMAANALGEIALAQPAKAARDGIWADAGAEVQKALTNKDRRIRRSAAYALGAMGDAAVAAAADLRGRLKSDDSPDVRQNAAWALGRLGDGDPATVAELCEALTSPRELIRRDAAAALGALGQKAGRDKLKTAARPLLAMVKDEGDEVVLKTGLQVLATLVGPEHATAAGDLDRLLRDGDAQKRRAAALVLAGLGGAHSRRAVPLLCAALADTDPSVQEIVAARLAEMAPHLIQPLREEGASAAEREAAVASAAEAARGLGKAVESVEDPAVRRTCAVALSQLGPLAKDAVAALARALERLPAAKIDRSRADLYEKVREQAAEAISNVRHPHNKAAWPALRKVIPDERNQKVRQQCVWALLNATGEELEEAGLVKTLTQVLNETSAETRLVRYDSARVLARGMKERVPDKAIDVLLQMLRDRSILVFHGTKAKVDRAGDEGRGGAASTDAKVDGDARFMAANSLAEIGARLKEHKEVIEELRRGRTDKDPYLREAATAALKRIGAD